MMDECRFDEETCEIHVRKKYTWSDIKPIYDEVREGYRWYWEKKGFRVWPSEALNREERVKFMRGIADELEEDERRDVEQQKSDINCIREFFKECFLSQRMGF